MMSLDPAQHQAAHDTDGPVLIYAGAGAGKTRVIAARVAILLDKGVPPDEILCITFTNKAAEEMRHRISQCTNKDISGIWIGTFHATCSRILREYGIESFTIYNGTDSLSALRRVMSSIKNGEYTLGEIQKLISDYKNSLLSGGFIDRLRVRRGNKSVSEFARIFSGYQEELERNNAFDFDDLLMKTVLMLKDSESIRDSVSSRFRYILIDEYQDTAEIESIFVNLLITRHGNICVVGDPKQAIYGFRGSDHRIIASFPQDYMACRTHILDTNYRSARQIVRASQMVIQGGGEKAAYMTTASRREDGILKITHYRNDAEESDAMVQEMKHLNKGGIPFSSIAVLCRTNNLAQSVMSILKEYGIPYQRVEGSDLLSNHGNRCVVSFLGLVMNPQDNCAAEYILKTLGHGVGKGTIDKLRDGGILATCGSANKPAGISEPAWATLCGFHNTVIHITLMAHLGRAIHEIIDYILHEPSLKMMVHDKLEELKVLSARHAGSATDMLPGFLEDVVLADSSGIAANIQNRVRVMTIHQAKGLEFPVVFMPGVEEGLLPHINASSYSELEEERRLCYVAMTRAINRLYMSSVSSRHVNGSCWKTEPSRFLKGLNS
ncbi:MAG: ATP-dependent helicase [Armatimonadota bacterium]